MDSDRIVLNLICLTILLAFASTPLLAQRGIDLLNPEEVLRAGESNGEADGAVTIRAMLAEAPNGVPQASHQTKTLQYDDGKFENFEQGGTHLAPNPQQLLSSQTTEWAQRFEVANDSLVVNAKVCFRRPESDPGRDADFKLRFYNNEVSNRRDYPGRRTGFSYVVEANIRRPGDYLCVLLRGDLVGRQLNKGTHWVSVEWNPRNNKRLGGDHYTSSDPADTDRNGDAVHETEVRYRTLPVADNSAYDGWRDPRNFNRSSTTTGLKAIGIRLLVEVAHATDPDPDPGTGPGTPADSACSAGTCRLADGRFRLRTRYRMPGMSTETADSIGVPAAALFTFGGDAPELLVRMVDDCSGSGYFGLYAGAATEADYSIAVRDTTTNELKWFRGLNGASVRNDMAFACNN